MDALDRGRRVVTVKDEAKYLCPYCAALFSTFEELRDHAVARHRGESAPVPQGMIRLRINGAAL